MRRLVRMNRTVGASMLFALVAALPATAQREVQFQAWCFDRATDAQVIEGCSAVIAAGRESTEKLAQAYYNRASAYLMGGDNKRAIDDYSESLKRQPFDAVVLLSRCHVRAIVGDLQPALVDCNESLRLAPSVPAALGSRGLVLLKLGRVDEAIADYDAGLKLFAKSAISLYGRGVAKRKKGDIAGGDADMATAKAMRGDVADLMATWGVSP